MSNNIQYLRASNGSGEAPRLTVTNARATSATTLLVDSVTNWPPYFIATSGVLNLTTDLINPATVTVFKGHISGSSIIIDSFSPGYTDIGNAVGDVVVLKPTTPIQNELVTLLEVAHNDDGTLNTASTTATTAAAKASIAADTNFRTKQRTSIGTSTATLTPNIDTYSVYELSAQAAALTIANPTGTPSDKDVMLFFLKDNGTARAITWGTNYTNISGLDSLVTTVLGKWSVVGAVYNATAAKWQIVSISTEA